MGERPFVAALFVALGLTCITLGTLSSGASPAPVTVAGGAMLALALALLGSRGRAPRSVMRLSAIAPIGPYRTIAR